MKKGAYGVVYQDVTRDSSLPLATKGLYAYLAAFCGADDECYPSVDTILRETGVSKETFYKYINVLVNAGVVKKEQINKNGRFGKTIYKLTHEINVSNLPNTIFPTTVKPIPKEPTPRKPTPRNPTTNNNNINSNSINNNSKKEYIVEQDSTKYPFKEIIEHLNQKSGKNYRYSSKVTQKHIKARIKEGFTLADFKRVIDWKVSRWIGTDMEQYLRPETLFGTKFESYLNEAPAARAAEPVSQESSAEPVDYSSVKREW